MNFWFDSLPFFSIFKKALKNVSVFWPTCASRAVPCCTAEHKPTDDGNNLVCKSNNNSWLMKVNRKEQKSEKGQSLRRLHHYSCWFRSGIEDLKFDEYQVSMQLRNCCSISTTTHSATTNLKEGVGGNLKYWPSQIWIEAKVVEASIWVFPQLWSRSLLDIEISKISWRYDIVKKAY